MRQFFRFIWGDKPYQFTCLPQGLASTPRLFTKLTKPALAHLRARGLTIVCYIDDCIIISPSAKQLERDIATAVSLFDNFGLTIHSAKSHLQPATSIEFLGFQLDSMAMSISLPVAKKNKILGLANDILKRTPLFLLELWPNSLAM